MAKKKSARDDDFNMAEEIRKLLTADPSLGSRKVFETLVETFPGRSINRNSCNVAFSHARRKLGIKPKGRGAKAVRRPGRGRSAGITASTGVVDLALLKSASKFLAEAGSSQNAINAIQQVAALQVSR